MGIISRAPKFLVSGASGAGGQERKPEGRIGREIKGLEFGFRSASSGEPFMVLSQQ